MCIFYRKNHAKINIASTPKLFDHIQLSRTVVFDGNLPVENAPNMRKSTARDNRASSDRAIWEVSEVPWRVGHRTLKTAENQQPQVLTNNGSAGNQQNLIIIIVAQRGTTRRWFYC